jgi:acyl-coenzyme A synthetase/AMP-(fatty) acid ligase/thioesterase domain-containing protein/acyl carrier protein
MAIVKPVTADTSIAERFRAIAASMPDALALVSPRRRCTYRELDRWSDAVAARIVAARAPLDAPVALVTRDHVALVPAALGAVKAGHYFVTIDPSDPSDRIFRASGASLPITDGDVAVVLTGAAPDARPHELVQLVFTSGTSGTPKAVVNRQRTFVERTVRAAARTGRAAGERVSYTALPGFARASSEIFGSLLNGATLCAFDARVEGLDALVAMIERERLSILTLTPALFRRFMRALPADADLSSVRKLRIGADVMTVADVELWRARFPRTTTLERSFNATEAGQVLHMSIDHDMDIAGPLVPIGRPVTGVEVRVVDEQRNDVPDGEVGELVVRGPGVVHGYWNDPELTAEKFSFERPDAPAFYTGDLVRRGEDGLYYFIGRRDARLKIHGRRIDPLEVESALVTCAGVREAAAVAEAGEDGEPRLAAYVAGATTTAREIRAALRERVPAWMIPAAIHIVESLPMTSGGKLDRAALALPSVIRSREDDEGSQNATAGALWLRSSSPRSCGVSAPQDDGIRAQLRRSGANDESLERTLLTIWSRVLGTEVAPDDDFFDDHGGESLRAAEIVAEVNRATGKAMPLSLLLELNTVAKMADYLRTRSELSRTVITLQKGGSLPPLFCVSGKGGSVIIFRELARLLGDDQPFYGLTHHGIDPEARPRTLAAIAACYADAIRATQAVGPYYLTGYSAGGFIAYEIARQMRHAGEEVAFLGLLDTVAGRQRVAKWRRSLRHLQVLRRRPIASFGRYTRAVARRFLWAAHWIRHRGTQSFTPPDAAEVIEANVYFDSLELQSALKPYDGAVTLFLARQGRGADVPERDAGWGALVRGPLEVIEIEGEHDSIIRADTAELAAPLKRALARARGR